MTDPQQATRISQSVAETARSMIDQFAEDPVYSNLHRLASEQLIAAVQGEDADPDSARRAGARLTLAEEYGKRALAEAKNVRQRMLTMGLIMTVNGVRVLLETGLETEVAHPETPRQNP